MSAKDVPVEATAAEHTSGPWFVTQEHGNALEIATSSRLPVDERDIICCVMRPNQEDIEQDSLEWANARLIAAAPDGLALARRVLKYFGNAPIDPSLDADIEVREMARAVIRKAEERT